VQKEIVATDSTQNNRLTLTLLWNLPRGRKYRDLNRTMNHRDTETCVLKKEKCPFVVQNVLCKG